VVTPATLPSEAGFRRLVNFSDAVVAIAITLLILPLVDEASTIGSLSVGNFLHDNRVRLFAFFLSFAVIGRFWWAQHQVFERIRSYNALLVAGMSLWLLSIVFLPFPTELLGAANNANATATHGLYVGTLVVASLAMVVQQIAIIRDPALPLPHHQGALSLLPVTVIAGLLVLALVVSITVPEIGLWALLVLPSASLIERTLGVFRVAGSGVTPSDS
jgi:uncharacterized membrane protein